MPKVKREFTLKAPAEKVWTLVSGFHGMHTWHPLVTRTKIENGGRTRNLALKGGGFVKEEVLKFDEQGQKFTYHITKGTMPFKDYSSTIQVKSAGKNACTLTWQGQFKPAKAPKEECAKAIAMVYETGAQGIKKKLKLR